MKDPALWSYQSPVPFELMTPTGVPEIFTYQNPTENQATADFICQWANRYTLVQYLLGTGSYGIGPVQHPTRTDLFARRAVIAGLDSQGFDGTWAQYRYAKLNVTFTPNPSGQIGNDNTTGYITVDSQSTGEFMTLPGRELVWDAPAQAFDGKGLSEPQQIYVPKKTHHITVHQWFSPPFSTMDAVQGKINSIAVGWIGRSIPANNLLFESYAEQFDVYIQGIPTMKVDMTFIEKSRSWNMFPRPTGVFWNVSPQPFTATSFAGIFP